MQKEKSFSPYAVAQRKKTSRGQSAYTFLLSQSLSSARQAKLLGVGAFKAFSSCQDAVYTLKVRKVKEI